jgi:hypothetical protein
MQKKIIGIENLSPDEINFELQKGARFVVYNYCISLLIVTLKRASDVYFIRPGDGAANGIKYSAISLVAGWWGIPWGPIYTIQSVYKNSKGGIDITPSVVETLNFRFNSAARAAK